MPWIKIVILSGYDDFNYAQTAIRLGVTEYLLKPIRASELVLTLQGIAAQIEEERKKERDLEVLQAQIQGVLPLLRERFLNELVLGLIQPEEALIKAASYRLDLIGRYFLVEVIEVRILEETDPATAHLEYFAIDEIVSASLGNGEDVIHFNRSLQQIVLVIKAKEPAELEERAYGLAQTLRHEITRRTPHRVAIGIGGVTERIPGIRQSFSEAVSALRHNYLFGMNPIIGIQDVQGAAGRRQHLQKPDHESLLQFLKLGSPEQARVFLKSYLEGIRDSRLEVQYYLHFLLLDILFTLGKYVSELGGDSEEILPELSSIEALLVKISCVDQMIECAERLVRAVISYRNTRKEDKYGGIIRKAEEYIRQNYADGNISLNSLAAHVGLSPSHFSTVFSQGMGMTFIELLTRTRIERAKELLRSTSLRSSEITYQVGYGEPHYFSFIFKKNTGLTPSEFRNRNDSDSS